VGRHMFAGVACDSRRGVVVVRSWRLRDEVVPGDLGAYIDSWGSGYSPRSSTEASLTWSRRLGPRRRPSHPQAEQRVRLAGVAGGV